MNTEPSEITVKFPDADMYADDADEYDYEI